MKLYIWRIILPIFILWLAFGLRLYRLDFQSIWWDEGHSIFVASHPISDIPTIPAMDVHPPAYFTLLHLWTPLAGQSLFAMRYLSVIFSLLTISLIWRFARYTSSDYAPAVAAVLASLSPMYVAYAQEIRSYAMITFLALGSTLVLWQIISNPPEKRIVKQGLFYIILTTASLYTHYFTIFLLIFHNLVWLLWTMYPSKNRLYRLKLWGILQITTLLLFLPQLSLALRQITTYTNPNLIPPDLSYFISRSWQAYTVGLTIDPASSWWGMWFIAAVLIWQMIKSRSLQLTAFLLVWLLLPLAAYFAVLQRQPSFEPRYMMLITPAIFLILASNGFTFRRISALISIIPAIVFIFSLHSYYKNETYFKDDSAGVADWLATETRANDIVYVDVPHPFHYYVKQKHIPAPTRYLFVDIHTAADILTREAVGRDRLYWVTWSGSDTDPRGVIPFLTEKVGQKIGEISFRGYNISWFDLPNKEYSFSLPTTLTPSQATFGDVLRLDGLAYPKDTLPAGEPVWTTLHFTLLRDTDVDYRVSLRLRGEDNLLLSQQDKDLLNDRHFHTSAWPTDDPALNQTINVYILPPPAPGSYRLEAVIYNSTPPYPAEGVSGHDSNDGVAATVGIITINP